MTESASDPRKHVHYHRHVYHKGTSAADMKGASRPAAGGSTDAPKRDILTRTNLAKHGRSGSWPGDGTHDKGAVVEHYHTHDHYLWHGKDEDWPGDGVHVKPDPSGKGIIVEHYHTHHHYLRQPSEPRKPHKPHVDMDDKCSPKPADEYARHVKEAAAEIAKSYPDWARSTGGALEPWGQSGEWTYKRGPPYVKKLTMFKGVGVDQVGVGTLIRRVLGLNTAAGRKCDLTSCDHAMTGNSYLSTFDGLLSIHLSISLSMHAPPRRQPRKGPKCLPPAVGGNPQTPVCPQSTPGSAEGRHRRHGRRLARTSNLSIRPSSVWMRLHIDALLSPPPPILTVRGCDVLQDRNSGSCTGTGARPL